MQSFLDHFGVAVAAITGVLAARGKQVDLFGAIVLALVTAIGGGTIRDVTIGDVPVFWAAHSSYLINITITALVTFYLVRFHELPGTVLLVADAFALAMFSMAGARKGEIFHLPPGGVVAMAVITGVAGGILRDVLLGELPLVFRPATYLYATAAFFGASLFALLRSCSVDLRWSMILGTVATLLLRLAGIRWRIALPMLRPKNQGAPPPKTREAVQDTGGLVAGSARNKSEIRNSKSETIPNCKGERP